MTGTLWPSSSTAKGRVYSFLFLRCKTWSEHVTKPPFSWSSARGRTHRRRDRRNSFGVAGLYHPPAERFLVPHDLDKYSRPGDFHSRNDCTGHRHWPAGDFSHHV